MVSFSCARCGDVVKKPKVVSHASSCGTTSYSCVDCMQVFDLHSIAKHTSCISEVQKYQGKWVPDFKKQLAKDSDEDDEETTKKSHTMQRKARPKLSFTDSSDSDDDSKTKKKAAPAAAKKSVVAASKRTRDSDSDSDVDDKKASSAPKTKAAPRTASPAIAAKKSPKASPKITATAASSTKLETLRLPASNVSDGHHHNKKGTIPSDREYAIENEVIPLGTHELIGEIVDEIIAEQKALNNTSHPTAAVIGQELVLRYRKRLGKAMAKAIAPILQQRGL